MLLMHQEAATPDGRVSLSGSALGSEQGLCPSAFVSLLSVVFIVCLLRKLSSAKLSISHLFTGLFLGKAL